MHLNPVIVHIISLVDWAPLLKCVMFLYSARTPLETKQRKSSSVPYFEVANTSAG